ncbi:MAG: TetR/AcrR family transcriptional regulator [Acidimicrobiales bacterium]|nr:TetR/AcrR family transcriptional regulator [Acidimicrobiales bacterium]
MVAAETPTELTEKGAQTRAEILRIAVDRFGRDGFRATSVADIARDADVSGTLAYAYFDNKKALFLAALDADVADLIHCGVSSVLETPGDDAWRTTLILTLLEALDHHPLAHRILAGKEPDVADRVVDLPAMEDLRLAVVARIRADQEAGLIRADIDPEPIGGGIVNIFVSMLLAAVQFGTDEILHRGVDVLSVVAAAIDPVD